MLKLQHVHIAYIVCTTNIYSGYIPQTEQHEPIWAM